jgi:hypothetical protein
MTCEHCGFRWVTPMDLREFGICTDCLQWQDLEGAIARDHENFYRIATCDLDDFEDGEDKAKHP